MSNLFEDVKDTMDEYSALMAKMSVCQLCELSKTRCNVVPGEGDINSPLMFIGEGPGADEDASGRPFVGRAGQLLTKIIEAMGYKREEVYIANIVKCRPPNNRVPTDQERNLCLPYLFAQIELIKPKVIVLLGATALHGLIDPKLPITKSRGKWLIFDTGASGAIKVMPTFHPAALLRDPNKKIPVWEDMKRVMEEINT